MIMEGEFAKGESRQYVKCRTEEDAKALANLRLFLHIFENRHLYSPNEIPSATEVDKTILALENYRWANCVAYRHLKAFAAELRTPPT